MSGDLSKQACDGLVLGVDVGTGSARAGLFDSHGERLGYASEPIGIWRPEAQWAEQSSDDIWRAVCTCVRGAVAEAGVSATQIVGVGFDATCSLVVVDQAGAPVAVSPGAPDERNVIVWMDHRAVAEAEEINSGSYSVLDYVGGEISPEMEIPKLLWLSRHMRASYDRAGRFFDLADFLSWRATGENIRSECTTVCKWTYLAHERRWDADFLADIGLGELPSDRCGVSGDIRPIGSLAGRLTADAAAELGLDAGTAVAVGAIDAHAGGIGLLGNAFDSTWEPERLSSALALIGGTSSCHMAVSNQARFIPGVWGPYFGAMVPDMWLSEGGQSAAGSLIDFAIDSHPACGELERRASQANTSRYEYLNDRLARLSEERELEHPALLARNLHILDYHLGNRTPHADPRARGVVDGLGFDISVDALAITYLATIQAVAYGTRRIIDALDSGDYSIQRVLATGGGTKNPIWLREHADAIGLELRMGREQESVVLGAAILAAAASGVHKDVASGMLAMARAGETVSPNPRAKRFHDAKYECYKRLYQCHLANRAAMSPR